MKPKVRAEYTDKNSYFELRLLFNCPMKIFCKFHKHVQGIWKVHLTWFFALVKNIDHTTHQSDYIARTSWGKPYLFSAYSRQTKVCTTCYVKKCLSFVTKERNHFICYERTKPTMHHAFWKTSPRKT